MAKELPYFQFEPAEYLTKDISFCSLSAQGLFTNICSYYWQRGCKLTKDQLLRRLNHIEEFDELIDEGIIDLSSNGNDIKIKFLDVQYKKATNQSETNRVNGSKGGRPKKQNPIESETKAKLNPIESEVKGIREDKIREDKIKQEIIINNENFLNESLESNQWLDTAGMQNRVKKEVVKLYLKYFANHLITMEEQKKNSREFKAHFMNWMAKQDLSAHREKKIGKSNQY